MRYLFILLAASLSLFADNGFISSHDLDDELNNNKLIIIDIGSKEDYTKGHLPNARSTHISQWRHTVDSYMLMNSPKDIELLMQSYGINVDSKVVIYEHNKKKGLLKASYLALCMARVGFTNTLILDGGMGEWSYHENPITKKLPKITKGNFKAQPNNNLLVDLTYVKQHLNKVPMIEARPEGFYYGRLQSKGVERLGHISGAMSNFWKNSFEEDGMLSPQTKLNEIFLNGLELEPKKEVLLYCTGGLEASMNWFVLSRVMKFQTLRVYDASLRQWGNLSTTPMVRYKWELYK